MSFFMKLGKSRKSNIRPTKNIVHLADSANFEHGNI